MFQLMLCFILVYYSKYLMLGYVILIILIILISTIRRL